MSQKRNFPQSLAVTLAFRLRSLKLRFFRSGTFVQAAFPLSYISTSSLRPLCSTAVTRFLATMGLSDSRQGPTTGYLFPVAVLPLRASQVPLPIFPRALPPLTPTSPTIACARYFIAGPRLPLLRLIGHSFLLCNEAETVRLRCGSRVRLARPRQWNYSHSRLLGYLPNGQSTRYPPFRILDRPGLSWRFQRTQRKKCYSRKERKGRKTGRARNPSDILFPYFPLLYLKVCAVCANSPNGGSS